MVQKLVAHTECYSMRDVTHDLNNAADKDLEIASARHGQNQHLWTTAIEFAPIHVLVETLEIDSNAEATLAQAVDDPHICIHDRQIIGS